MAARATTGKNSSDAGKKSAAEQKVVKLAEQFGWFLGTASAKAEGWIGNPKVRKELASIRDGAATLLQHIDAAARAAVRRIGYPVCIKPIAGAGSADTFHVVTHEEGTDAVLGYQPKTYWFQQQTVEALRVFLMAFDGIKEGPGTLLDRCLIFNSTDTGYAKLHAIDNIPLMTFGSAAGRLKTGYHIAATGDSVTRVGLTCQQAMGMQVGRWGSGGNQTNKPFSELLV